MRLLNLYKFSCTQKGGLWERFLFSDIVSFDLPDGYCIAMADASGPTQIEGMQFTYAAPEMGQQT